MKYLDLDLIENPYGKRIGGGYETVLAGGGDRSHIKGDNGKPLCMQKVSARDVRPSSARTVTCYRCIKIMGMNSNAPFVTRSLTTSRGEKKPHLMMPGGRQGRMVADKKVSPYGETGAAPFKRGPANHPTQPWMTTRVIRAKTREERLREEGIALPVAYTPFSFAESVPAPALYASPAALKKRGAKGIMAAAAKVQALGEIRANPKGAAASMGGLAMYVHTSGQAPSLRAAWAMLGKQTPGLTDRFGDEIQYTQDSRTGKVGWYSEQAEHFKMMSAGHYNNPRRLPSSAQSEAALAMYVHTSGQAPSLKSAWAMLRRQTPGLTDRSGDEIVYHVDQRTGKVGFYSEQAEHEALMGAGHYNPRQPSKNLRELRDALIEASVDAGRYDSNLKNWTDADIIHDPEGFLSDAKIYARMMIKSIDLPGNRKRATPALVHRLEDALAAAGGRLQYPPRSPGSGKRMSKGYYARKGYLNNPHR